LLVVRKTDDALDFVGDAVLRLDPGHFAVQKTMAVGGEPDGLGATPVPPRAACHACTTDSK
jgi:hypothetical protein